MKVTENQRRTWQQQQTWQQTQAQNLDQEIKRLEQEKKYLENQLITLQQLLSQAPQIEENYHALLNLQKEEELFSNKFILFQEAQQKFLLGFLKKNKFIRK